MHRAVRAQARVWAGDADCRGDAVTGHRRGRGQRPGETLLDLVAKNAAIFRSIVPQVAEANPDGIILVATNPVDVLSYLTYRISMAWSGSSAAARSSTRAASGC